MDRDKSTDTTPTQPEDSTAPKAEETKAPEQANAPSGEQYRLDQIYHVVRDSSTNADDLILSMTVMENPPAPGK